MNLKGLKSAVLFGAGVCFSLSTILAEGVALDEGPPMVLVEGGSFRMGDVFGEGGEDEKPVHQVTLADFYLSRFEVTVGDFTRFVSETGYATSAEAPMDTEKLKKLMEKAMSADSSPDDRREIKREMLEIGGAAYWHADQCRWTGYDPETNWRNVGFVQADTHPVMAISPEDAMAYCNWLSVRAGLPVAYDLKKGGFLDRDGRPTVDIREVKGYRLPTEAEWEYAARERGREVRFGTGKNKACSSEMNFRADAGDYSYLERGEYRKGTTPVGSFPPNSLGLHDMGGNAWEWTADYCEYGDEPQENPCCGAKNVHALRGGRWGGDAFEARVFHRSAWVRNDRCNNSGFRVARSAS